MTKLSIIVPLYNNRRFIKKCLDSCLSQGLDVKEYEIIIVNDASTDGGEIVANTYVNKYPQIKIVNHKDNKGCESTRLSGILKAKGEYIFILDSDDWLSHNSIKPLLEMAINNDYDMVTGRKRRVATIGNFAFVSKKIKQSLFGEFSQPELIENYWVSLFGKSVLPFYITGSLIRRELVSSEYFHTGMRLWEDLYEHMMIFPNYNKIYYSESQIYNYRLGGVTSVFNPRLYTDHKTLFRLRLKAIDEYHYEVARYYACGEMKNVFKQIVCEMILHKTISKDEILRFIQKEFDDDIWNSVFLPDFSARFKNPEFTKAMIDKDADAIYDICHNEAKSIKMRNFTRRFWNFMFIRR